jgi:hypothetical protein
MNETSTMVEEDDRKLLKKVYVRNQTLLDATNERRSLRKRKTQIRRDATKRGEEIRSDSSDDNANDSQMRTTFSKFNMNASSSSPPSKSKKI